MSAYSKMLLDVVKFTFNLRRNMDFVQMSDEILFQILEGELV